MTESIAASCDVETKTDSGLAMGSCAKIGCAISARINTIRVKRGIRLFGRLQLDSGAARIQTRQRNRQPANDIDLTQQRARDRVLQTWHVAVRDDVGAQAGIVLQ